MLKIETLANRGIALIAAAAKKAETVQELLDVARAYSNAADSVRWRIEEEEQAQFVKEVKQDAAAE